MKIIERVEVYSLQYRKRSTRQLLTRYFLTQEERAAHVKVLEMDHDVECISVQCNYWLPETVLGRFGTTIITAEIKHYAD
jgi:hypothetical protein